MNHKDATVLWIDNGLFVSFAAHISTQFKKSYYWTPWVSGFPRSNPLLPGFGLDGIERVRHWEPLFEEVDLFIFPDVYYGTLQVLLSSLGKRVWGPRLGESLELKRWTTKQLFKSLGMPVAHSELIVGLDNLREHLKSHEDVWIKVSAVRGDMETWHSMNYDLSETRLDQLEQSLGAKKHIEEFIVENAIRDAIETGFDGWIIDGESPQTGMAGVEIKDEGYLLAVKDKSDIPPEIIWCNDKLKPFFKGNQYRGWYSTEVRIVKEGDELIPYLIDPTCRCGSPPNEIYQNLFSNWGEIIWNGAVGELVEPEPVFKFGAEALIHSGFADSNWQPVYFPDSVRPFIKLRNHCRINGKDYVVPQDAKLPEIGAVIGVGNTMDEAIKHLQENCSQVKGYYLDIKTKSIPVAIEEMEKAEQMGVTIIDPSEAPKNVEIEQCETD